MPRLTLHPGPRLLRQTPPPGGPEGSEDVTPRAVEFLFDPLELAEDLRLGDLLGLIERCPELTTVYRRLHAGQIAAEAALGPAPEDERSDLRFLELRQVWRYDSHRREYSDVRRLDLSGIGAPGADEDGPREEDGPVRYSLSGLRVRSILHLPLRLKTEVAVHEADSYSMRSQQCVRTERCRDLLLGELLHAVLWEMTWFGPPGETPEFLQGMESAAEASGNDQESWRTTDADEFMEEFFGEDDRRGCEALFESIGAMTPTQIASALRRIPDRSNGRRWLARHLGPGVRLKPAFHRLGGRDLRQAFGEA